MSHVSDLISEDILAYLGQHERKEMLRFLTCGNVDDGKSTLIGRLLHDSKMIYEDHLEAITRDSKKSGTTGDDIDLALLNPLRYFMVRAFFNINFNMRIALPVSFQQFRQQVYGRRCAE